MGLRINNPLSLRVTTQLQRTQKAMARSLERLSTGQQVNSPRDDARAYVLGVGLTAQIRGLAAANLGLNTALGILETADTAMSAQLDLVQRMRELAIQAANGNLTDADRSNLNVEVQQLLEEYNRITTQTSFNGTTLLDGSFSGIRLQAGSNKGDTINLSLTSMQPSDVFTATLPGDSPSSPVAAGTFQARSTIATGSGPHSIIAVDVNGDTFLDLITSDYTNATASIALGNGNGTFQTRTTMATGTQTTSVIAADVNGDTKLDLISTDYSTSTSSILFGNGNGTFQTRITVATGTNPAQVVAIDLNGDSKLDLITADTGGNTLSILLGNGNGTFKTRTTMATGTSPRFVIAVDVSGDGKLDLMTADNNGATTSILLGNGNGTFQTRTTMATGSNPYTVALADLNEDGKLDLITSDFGSSTVSIFFGNGNGTFQTRLTVLGGANPYFVLARDMNADGHLDLITTDNTASTASILLGNGNGTFQARTTAATGSGPIEIAVGDFNGDTYLDFVTADNSSSTASILLANAATVVTGGDTYLGLTDVTVATQSQAETLITMVDNVIATITEARADVGALHSRLDFAISSNLLLSENLTEARSNALDTDYAIEVADLVKNQILEYAQIAALTQANLSRDLILRLLEFKN